MKWSVTGTVSAGTYIGEVEADTAEEALKEAQEIETSVSVCHQCTRKISDPEIERITVCNEDGTVELSDDDELMRPGVFVRKPKGYRFEGVIQARFTTTGGADRVVVENGDGMLHIFNLDQLEVEPTAIAFERFAARRNETRQT